MAILFHIPQDTFKTVILESVKNKIVSRIFFPKQNSIEPKGIFFGKM